MSDIGEVLLNSTLCWPYAARQRHATVPPALNVFWDGNPSCGMLAGFATKTQKPSNLCQLQAHLRNEPGVCSVYIQAAHVWPFPRRSWKQQGNARPGLPRPTGWTHVDTLLESHRYAKQRPFPTLDSVDS